jgi:hypothetical protein
MLRRVGAGVGPTVLPTVGAGCVTLLPLGLGVGRAVATENTVGTCVTVGKPILEHTQKTVRISQTLHD